MSGATLKKLGKYEIIRELGRGAMGVVFKARDPFIGRLVALKTITATLADNRELLQRFYREAQAAGSLQHPNVVTVFEMGEQDGAPFIVMEYLEGETLEQLIARQPPLPVALRLGYIIQACHALDYAHRRGIVHRDIKPPNLMVTTEGAVKVVDFGIARVVDTSKTQTGQLLGTLGYMSPQQLRGKRADERSDIWAMGVMLYELLSYQKPFAGDNHAALILSIISDEPRPITEVAPDCPPELGRIVQRLLSKQDTERYQSIEELLVDLEPLWKRLQQSCVGDLVARSRQLIGIQRLPEARENLRQALLIDTSSTQARVLLEEVNGALKDTVLRAELEEHVARAKSLLQEGLLEDAQKQAKAALELDSFHTPARQLLEQIERAARRERQQRADREKRVAQQVRTIGAAIDGGDLSGAIQLGRQTIAEVGGDAALTQILEVAERRQREQTDQQLRAAFSALEAGQFEEGERLLLKLQEAVRDDLRLPPLLEAAREKKIPAAALLELAEVDSGASPNDPTHAYVISGSGSLEARSRRPSTGTLATGAHAGATPLGGPVSLGVRGKGVATAAPVWKRPVIITPIALAVALGIGAAFIHKTRARKPPVTRDVSAPAASPAQVASAPERPAQGPGQPDQPIPQPPASDSAPSPAATGVPKIAPVKPEKTERTHIAPPAEDKNQEQSAALSNAASARFAQLESRFKQAERAGDESARQQIEELLGAFRAIADGDSPLAPSARNYADNLIPAALKELDSKAAKASAEAAENARYNDALVQFRQAREARDINALKTRVLPEFQRLAQGGGLKAAEAAQYVSTQIPAAIRDAAPWPAIGCPASPAGMAPRVKAGDLVACGLLDPPKVKWARFSWPEFPGRARQAGQQKGMAMLSLTVDESGSVIDAKPRGTSDALGFSEAAASAARQWKTNPPRVQGKPVRTEFAVDIPFSQ